MDMVYQGSTAAIASITKPVPLSLAWPFSVLRCSVMTTLQNLFDA